MLTITNRMKDIREKRRLSQENISKLLNMTQQQYHLYESGKRKIPIDKLREFCKICDISADYILGLSDNMGN